VAVAERAPLDRLQQATAVHLRARIAFAERRGSRALPLLLDAARRLEPLDPDRARHAYLETLGAAIFAGRMAHDPTLPEVAAQARAAGSGGDGVVDLLVDGLSTRFTDGYADAVVPLRRVLDRLASDRDADDALPWLWMGCRIASDLWADDVLDVLTDRQVRLARSRGALPVLSLALALRAGVHMHGGEFAAADALMEESRALTAAVGGAQNLYTAVLLDAWRGDEGVLRFIEDGIEIVTGVGEGRSISWAEYARALYFNGTGAYPEALVAARSASAHDDLGVRGWPLFELVEAAVRSDRPDLAAEAVERIGERAAASGTPWARGVEARSRALLAEGPAAEELYRSAIDHLAGTRVAVHLARTYLVFGEWLRRENRRVDAREQLRAAHEMFSRFGAEAFAERARRELLATGETARRRTVTEVDVLTPQESQIARLARDGHTNPEIGSQLFISPRTVEYHLRKVFTKLDITSRRELRRALLDPA
jgi:DNA-binding CsgD family transcriptional regulator